MAMFESRVQQLEAILQQQVQRNGQLEAALQQQQASSSTTVQPQVVDVSALGAMIASQLAQAVRGQPRSVVDIRGIGKPAPFKGEEEKFRMFAQKLVGFMTAVWPEARNVMQWAADQMETFDDDEAELEWTDSERSDPFPGVREFSGQLHAALIGLVEGEAFDLVIGVEGCCGLEAWRKLTRRYDPQVAGRSKNMLKNVLNPPQCKAAEMLAGMEQWEQLCRRYCGRKGADGKRRELPEDILMGILQEMGPPELRTHLYLNSQKFKTYLEMRNEIVSFLEAKVGARPYRDDPMDVSSMVMKGRDSHKGKGKGKSKDTKAKGKQTGTAKNGKDAKFDGYCSNPNCGKWGHKWSECWKEGGGAYQAPAEKSAKGAKGKGKDKSKGKSKGKHANALDGQDATWQESQQQAPQQVQQAATSSLGICALRSSFCGSVGRPASCNSQEEQWEKVEMTLDSGSAVSACPESVGVNFGYSAPATGFHYITADGRASVPDKGQRNLKVVMEDGLHASMNMRVAGVHKPLVSAGDVTSRDNVIILSKYGSFVARDPNGAIHRKAYAAAASGPGFWLYKKNGVYTFPVWINKQATGPTSAGICPVDEVQGGVASSGFPAAGSTPQPAAAAQSAASAQPTVGASSQEEVMREKLGQGFPRQAVRL